MIKNISFVFAALLVLVGCTCMAEDIPEKANLDLKIGSGEYELAGRLRLRRFFLGTRSEAPQYQNLIQFYSFTGQELKFLKFDSEKVEAELFNLLVKGQQLPVLMKVRCEHVTVGHDGINMSKRLKSRVLACTVVPVESICLAAEANGYSKTDCEGFKSHLAADAVVGDIAISLEKVYVRANPPKGRGRSQISVLGIRVFNPTDKPVSVEIDNLQLAQQQKNQDCVRADSPTQWQVEANNWSDGAYQHGKSPKIIWGFNPSAPIVADQKVTAILNLKIDGKVVEIKRTVDPS